MVGTSQTRVYFNNLKTGLNLCDVNWSYLIQPRIFMSGAAQHRGSILASHPGAPGSIPSSSEFFSEQKLAILLRLIDVLVKGKWTSA